MALRVNVGAEALRCETDGVETVTSVEQTRTEAHIEAIYQLYLDLMTHGDAETEMRDDEVPPLDFCRHEHIIWARRGLFRPLAANYASLDSARPWLVYWNLHSLDLLGSRPDALEMARLRDQIARCVAVDGGGLAGAQLHLAHLASAYAGVSALMIIGDEASYRILDRVRVRDWLLSLKNPDGSFAMHTGGEVDCRSAYCAMVIATYYNVLTPALRAGLGEWIASCQTYEGGLGGAPGNEAHGGYTYCGVAALALLGELHRLNLPRLLDWLARRQMRLEGGFQGRTNKLVDSCYSWWQGATFALLAGEAEPPATTDPDTYLLHRGALQDYLMICSQLASGGFRDKPGKPRDFYHTCYGLSGLSVSQHLLLPRQGGRPGEVDALPLDDKTLYLGQTRPTHPIFNIAVDHVERALAYFGALPPLTD